MLVYDVAPMRHSLETDAYLIDLGDLIRRARERKGLSQDDLADQVGLSRTTLHRYEKGAMAPRMDTLLAMAESLELSRRALFSPPPKSRVVASDLERYLVGWAQEQDGTLSPHPNDDGPDT